MIQYDARGPASVTRVAVSCTLRRVDIQRLNAMQAGQRLPELAGLLQDAVASGASVGFLPPLPEAEATAYWREVVSALHGPGRILLIAARAVAGYAAGHPGELLDWHLGDLAQMVAG